MRRYETFIILDPDLSEDLRLPVIERVKEVMAQMGGFLIRIDEWGSRRLAYSIKKKERGYYLRFDFCGTAQLVNEMERFFRIDERVLKHMSVLLDGQPNLERIKEDMAKAEVEAEAQKPAEIAPAAPAEPVAPAEPTEPQSTGTPEPQQEA
jgi:small subunit ribosomal protein S6